MKKYIWLVVAQTLFIYAALGQENYTIKGIVKDSANLEPLIGATIKIDGTNKGTATNTKGEFSFTTNSASITLIIQYVGYQTKTLNLTSKNGAALVILLKPTGVQAKEAVVVSDRNNLNVTSTQMSKVELTGEQVKTLPVLFGEPDILKTITLLPGIKSGGEGGTGFYVRGGGPDQNLVLMDDATIYNPSHLLGFLSVFNTDAVKSLELIKGGIPANYGGRLSSILSVDLKEGNQEKYQVSGGIGLISSRLMLEGPIKKGKGGFMVAGRRTYIDALVKPFLTTEQKANGYYFYDFNAKAHYHINDKNKLVLSGYFGRDIFTFKSPTNSLVRFNIGWGNSAISFKWLHTFNKKLYSNTILTYNRYDLNNTFEFGDNGFKLSSGLKEYGLKYDFYYNANAKHQIKFGLQYIYHTFTPGIASGQVGTIKIDEKISNQLAHEAAVYFADEFKLGKRLTVQAGLRGVLFTQVGPYTETIFDDQGIEIGKGKTYGKQEPIVTYPGLEPRLAATCLINSNTSIKASYTRMLQFIHLATTSGAQFPADLWVPSSLKVKPQIGNQFAVGVFKNFNENAYETSIEAYYKPMQNQIEFEPGAELFFNQNLENEMVFGTGLAYGVEFFVKKKFGNLTGWVGYTWSRATRQFDELNEGKTFYFRYDRTHDMSLVATYKLSKKWTGSMVFVYGTGNATTLPTGRYNFLIGFDIENNEPKFRVTDLYDKVNDFRLPAYHRLDVSFTYLQKQTQKFESSWNFSIYNVYNRANPYFIYFVPDLDALVVKAYMVYLFPILPSVAWNFKF